jgi:ATP-dependent exoDNAse (exonuclease V) alpha subunit
VHPDGHTSAFDTSALFFYKMAAGALYRAALAERLAELGFALEADKTSFRIAGLSAPLCEEFSKRRAEIEEELIRRFGSLEAAGPEAAALVAAETRGEKDERPRAELLREWRETAARHGLDAGGVRSLLSPAPPLSAEARDRLREAAFSDGVAKLSEAHAHWNERELVQRSAEAAQVRGIGARDVLEVVERKVSESPAMVHLGELVTEHRNSKRRVYKERSEARFTTEAILKLEKSLLVDAARLNGVEGGVDPRLVEEVLAARPGLSPEQGAAIRELSGGGNLRILVGDAGTGKTFVLNAVREAYLAQGPGHRVVGCALAGIASENLARGGVPSDTIAMTLYRLRQGSLKLTPKTLLVVDEAGMLGTKPLAELLSLASAAGARVLLTGDPKQLQPITQGGPLKHLVAEYGAARLRDIRRQREVWHREAVRDFSRGDAGQALRAFVRHRQLEVTRDRGTAMVRMVEDWKGRGGVERPGETMMLTGLVAEARLLNRLCQGARLSAGVLGQAGPEVAGGTLHTGDRVLFTKNSRRLGLKNGHTGTVLSVGEGGRRFAVRLDDGRRLDVPFRVYNPKHVSLGYAATTHKAQGSTLERVLILLGGPLSDRHMAYVQASRSRGECRLYIDRRSAGGNASLKEAVRTLSRERTKDLAHDVKEAAERRQPPRLHKVPQTRPLAVPA